MQRMSSVWFKVVPIGPGPMQVHASQSTSHETIHFIVFLAQSWVPIQNEVSRRFVNMTKFLREHDKLDIGVSRGQCVLILS